MAVKVLSTGNKLHATLEQVRKYCITKSPGFAGVALLPQYHIVDPKDELGKEYGFTDGNSIWFGTKLFSESLKAQAFVLIHEVLHVALRHPQRGLALKKARLARGLQWSNEVFNWAVDAIVNHSLSKVGSWVHVPKVGIVTFQSLLDPVVLKDRPPHTWNAESLFAHLMDNVIKNAADAAAWGDANLPNKGRGMLDIEVSGAKGESFSGEESKRDPIKPDGQDSKRNWEGRVKRAAAGDRPGGVMKEILFDIPVTKTPWQYILRKFVTDAVMPQTQIKPTRPSRQTIVLDSFYKETCNECILPFNPAYQAKPGIRKIVVVVDTSGSIDDKMCEYFAGEIQTIRKKTGCELTLITCDTEVHQVININPYENFGSVIKNNGGFKGRGGTNFVPGVAAAEKQAGVNVIVYLTDMMGPYPNRCRVPLLWASTCEKYEKPPVGTVVVLKDSEF